MVCATKNSLIPFMDFCSRPTSKDTRHQSDEQLKQVAIECVASRKFGKGPVVSVDRRSQRAVDQPT